IVGADDIADWQKMLAADSRLELKAAPADWQRRLQAGKTDLVIEVVPGDSKSGFRLWEEPRRAESRLARTAVERAMLRSEVPDWQEPAVKQLEQKGSRYIDFLLPGMIGM